MDRSVKIALAALVFLAGTFFAFLNRQPLPDQLGGKSSQASRLVLQGPRWSGSQKPLRFRSAKNDLPSFNRTSRSATRGDVRITEKPEAQSLLSKSTVLSPIDTGQPPPSLARVFPRYENSEDSRWGTAIGHRLPGSDRHLESRPVTHFIVDGDTLDALADRYLGDSLRAVEIFEVNRHLLTDPNALPIGVELTIPSGLPSPVGTDGIISPEGLVPDKPLVPVVVPD